MKISLWKKLKLYFQYRKSIINNKKDFEKYNLRVDRVNRIYTVINIPPEMFEEPYNIRTADINKISEPYITEYIRRVSLTLNEKGLTELYRLYDISKVDKYSYLIVIGFSLFDTGKVARSIYLRYLPISFVLITLFIMILKLL